MTTPSGAIPAPGPRRPLLTRPDREHLRHLADNAWRFAERAGEASDDHYDIGAGELLAEVLSWLAGDDPSDYLTKALAD